MIGMLKLEEAGTFDFVTHHPSTAAVTDADSGPTAEVFEDATDTTVVALTVTKRTSKTGNYRCTVTAAAADGFEVGKTYNIVASATVNSIAGKGVIGRFKVRARGQDDLAIEASLQGLITTIGASAAGVATAVWAAATRLLTAGTNIVLAKGVGVTGFTDISAAQVNAEVVDAINVDTYAEPGQGAPSATTSIAAKVNYLYKFLRNRVTQDATTLKVYADDAVTVDQKSTVSDNGTTYDRGEIAGGP